MVLACSVGSARSSSVIGLLKTKNIGESMPSIRWPAIWAIKFSCARLPMGPTKAPTAVTTPIEREEVTIERRPVDGERKAGGIDDDLTDHDSINIPVSEEQINVDKESVVDEEVVVRKDKVQDTEHVSEDVRHEELDIDETDNSTREERNRKSEQEPDYPGQNRDRL